MTHGSGVWQRHVGVTIARECREDTKQAHSEDTCGGVREEITGERGIDGEGEKEQPSRRRVADEEGHNDNKRKNSRALIPC